MTTVVLPTITMTTVTMTTIFLTTVAMLQVWQDDSVSVVCGAQAAATLRGQLSHAHGERRLPGWSPPRPTPQRGG